MNETLSASEFSEEQENAMQKLMDSDAVLDLAKTFSEEWDEENISIEDIELTSGRKPYMMFSCYAGQFTIEFSIRTWKFNQNSLRKYDLDA